MLFNIFRADNICPYGLRIHAAFDAVGTAVHPPACNYEKFLIKNEKTLKKGLTWDKISDRITFVLLKRHRHGGVAQLARAYGSYP